MKEEKEGKKGKDIAEVQRGGVQGGGLKGKDPGKEEESFKKEFYLSS